jgi:hypothetical protein
MNTLVVTRLAAGNDRTDIAPYGTRITANAAEANERLAATSLDSRPGAAFAALD